MQEQNRRPVTTVTTGPQGGTHYKQLMSEVEALMHLSQEYNLARRFNGTKEAVQSPCYRSGRPQPQKGK